MLFRIVLLGLLVTGAVYAYRWWKSRNLLGGTGSLNLVELNELLKIAKGSQRMEAVLMIRTQIINDAKGDRAEMTERMDTAIRKLANQEKLMRQIDASLSRIDRKKLKQKIAEAAEAAAKTSDEVDRGIHEDRKQQLESQQEQIGRLEKRQKELVVSADRIVTEMQSLHMALLEASSSNAALSSAPVQTVLGHLEEAGEELRRQASAEDEVHKLLRASQQQSKISR